MSEEKKPVRPWDLFLKNKPKLDEEGRKRRLQICMECDKIIKLGLSLPLETALVQDETNTTEGSKNNVRQSEIRVSSVFLFQLTPPFEVL